MPKKGDNSAQQKVLVDQTLRMLSFIERSVSLLRSKIEKDQTVPGWLVVRLQQVVMELNLIAPFTAQSTKKFEPSEASKQ